MLVNLLIEIFLLYKHPKFFSYPLWEAAASTKFSFSENSKSETLKEFLIEFPNILLINLFLSNLVTDFYWSGNSIYLDPHGYFYAPRKDYAPDDIAPAKSYWILSRVDLNRIKKSVDKLDHFKSGTAVWLLVKKE